MKTNFLAGLIATLISIFLVVGLALVLALVLEVDASKNWFTTTAAFLTIGCWLGVYKWLKPKGDVPLDQYGFEIETEVAKIDDSVFKTAYLKTSKKGFTVGVFLALFGLPSAICVLVFAGLTGGTSITGFIMLLIFGLLGVLVAVVTARKLAKIKDGTDTLIQALDNNDQDYVVWFHGVITKQAGTSIKELQTYMIMVYAREMKKAVTVSVKNEKAYNEILLFLETKFPTAETGYDAETKKRMKEKYGFKGLM
jgi:hypothetical protein